MTGKEYLEFIKEKLHIALAEIDESIQDVQEDIKDMHEYYWENYTEMDEYGYENFDNQQALLGQVNARGELAKRRVRIAKMCENPFFGKVDFVFDGEDEPESFYIGIANFSDQRGGVPLIYDWRAPVSSLFYDYDKGLATYIAPGGEISGEITSKWQYKIRRGKMLYELESDIKIDDEILKQELSEKGDTKLKSIVHTIQKEQNAIIRNVKDKILVIQGVAGSGKTSVALHRIAYLLYHDREHLNSSNILVLSPNTVFSDYISRILPELGEENIQEMSLDLFAYKELKGIVADCEDRFDFIEEQMAGIPKEEEARYRYKQSEDFIDDVEGFLLELEDSLMTFKSIEYRKLTMKEDEILTFFYERFPDVPLLRRMDSIFEYFVDEYETLTGKKIKEEELENLKNQFDSMYETKDIYVIYNMLLEELGYETLPHKKPENRYLKYEDVYPLLYLKARLNGVKAKRKIRHLVIDEMQDYSYLQFVLLKNMFNCNMTILGDWAQTVDSKTQDVLSFLPALFKGKARIIEMKKSYRNTLEIAEYAKSISGITDIEYVTRPGKPVEILDFAREAEIVEYLAGHALRSPDTGLLGAESEVPGIETLGTESEKQAVGTLGTEPEEQAVETANYETAAVQDYETAAVLTATLEEAKDVYEALKTLREDVSFIDRNSSQFKSGITVTTFYLAKGLEFDQVFQIDRDAQNPLHKECSYICATRALHELYVLKTDRP